MAYLKHARELTNFIATSASRDALRESLSEFSKALGFRYFAVSHQRRSRSSEAHDIRDHNYPREWEETYDRRQLGRADPIHRASNVRAAGFRWRDGPAIIPYTERDLAMIDEARRFGIEDGYTVPAHVHGERPGSVTFVTGTGDPFPDDMILFAEAFGHVAFGRLRVLCGQPPLRKPAVTDHLLDVLVLVGRDKSNAEIGELMRITEDTVMKHVAALCLRLGALKRTSLPMRAVMAGLLDYSDILP